MPNGDFTNPRYWQENATLSDRDLLNKYGYVPNVSSEDYDCEKDYLDALESVRRLNGDEE